MKKILVTGNAGFIGFHVCKYLLDRKNEVIGVDNLNDYYDVSLKESRLEILSNYDNFKHYKLDITDKDNIKKLFSKEKPQKVINLAAQAGVRYSIKNPDTYINSNIVGFLNIIENCRYSKIEHLVYASSSSVYGLNENLPFSVNNHADHPISLYGATKRSNELMAHSYSYLYQLPTTGLRFFTVYGPWGRPDMALFLFTKAIMNDEPFEVFNYGNHKRDFTYIDDIVKGVIKVLDNPAKEDITFDTKKPNLSSSNSCWRIYNIGNNKSIKLMEYIKALEKSLNKSAKINFKPLQDGDVVATDANIDTLIKDFSYKPSITINDGVNSFVKWYKKYYLSY